MKTLIIITLIAIVTACVQIIDIKGPAYQEKPVLIGILHPDSALSVRLSVSRPTNETLVAIPIMDARVAFLQDGRVLGQARQVADGVYQLPMKPTGGHKYAVSASLTNGVTLYGEDFLPLWPTAKLTVSDKNTNNVNGNPDLTIALNKALPDSTFLWMGLYSTQYFSFGYAKECIIDGQVKPGCVEDIKKLLRSNQIITQNVVFDGFNGFFDALDNRYENSSPARVRREVFNISSPFSIKFAPRSQGSPWTYEPKNQRLPDGENVLELFFVGPAYDRYLKSALVAFQNRPTDFEGDLFNPFAEPTPVYSNVKNGLGIFGARNGRYIILKLNSSYPLN